MKKKIYTTSEYVKHMVSKPKVGKYVPNYFGFFSSVEAADKDAQYLVDYYKQRGERRRKPVVYIVRLESVK